MSGLHRLDPTTSSRPLQPAPGAWDRAPAAQARARRRRRRRRRRRDSAVRPVRDRRRDHPHADLRLADHPAGGDVRRHGARARHVARATPRPTRSRCCCASGCCVSSSRPAGSRSRSRGCASSCAGISPTCARHARGSSRRPPRNAAGSSATCTTVRRSGSSRLASRSTACRLDGRLVLAGIGGAAPGKGSVLTGRSERISALGGTLRIARGHVRLSRRLVDDERARLPSRETIKFTRRACRRVPLHRRIAQVERHTSPR